MKVAGVMSHGAKDGYVGLFSSILKFLLASFVSVFQASSSRLSSRTGILLLNSPSQKLSSRNLQCESLHCMLFDSRTSCDFVCTIFC